MLELDPTTITPDEERLLIRIRRTQRVRALDAPSVILGQEYRLIGDTLAKLVGPDVLNEDAKVRFMDAKSSAVNWGIPTPEPGSTEARLLAELQNAEARLLGIYTGLEMLVQQDDDDLRDPDWLPPLFEHSPLLAGRVRRLFFHKLPDVSGWPDAPDVVDVIFGDPKADRRALLGASVFVDRATGEVVKARYGAATVWELQDPPTAPAHDRSWPTYRIALALAGKSWKRVDA